MFKFIHAADIHLDSPLRGLERYEGAPIEEIRGATRRALENLVDLALEQSVAFVLVAGDLYDGDWREFRTGLYFVSQMARLREAGIPVVLIAGNHDAANKMTRRLPLPDNVTVLGHRKPQSLRLDDWDVIVHGQSFASGAVTDNLAGGYPAGDGGAFNIGLLHTCATGDDACHQPYAPCTLDDLRGKEYGYWALGHIHKQGILSHDPPIVFCGNLQGRNIRETGPKGCMLVTVDDRLQPHLEHRALDVFRWERCPLDASDVENSYQLLDRIRAQLVRLASAVDDRSLAVRIEVAGASPIHRELVAEPHRWTNEVRAIAQDAGNDVWIEKIILNTSPPADYDRSKLEGPIGELVRYVNEIQSSPEKLAGLASEIADLREKLPPELKEGDYSLGLDQPEKLRAILDDVEQMLVHQLICGEPGK